jgi:hypothetical protein
MKLLFVVTLFGILNFVLILMMLGMHATYCSCCFNKFDVTSIFAMLIFRPKEKYCDSNESRAGNFYEGLDSFTEAVYEICSQR